MSKTHAFTTRPAPRVADWLQGIATAFRRNRPPREISRFPQHLLRDMGYELDWDGSIISSREG